MPKQIDRRKMAKKKPMFGVNNYHKRTPKKRPGVHTKRRNKRKPHRKKYRGQGRQFGILNSYGNFTKN